MTIGERIRKSREEKNMTLEELAARCGTIKQTIYKYEKGIITNIPHDKIEKIAKALGTTAEYIYSGKSSPMVHFEYDVSDVKAQLIKELSNLMFQLNEEELAEEMEHIGYTLYKRKEK